MKTKANTTLEGKKILVLATGSIAAVKTPLLVSSLVKQGAHVRCAISPSACKLISPLSLATLSRNRCYQENDQWDPQEPRPLHIALAEWADLIVIAPLSATSLAKWANGLADGLISSVLLAFEKRIIACAAMNTGMWNNDGVKRNWRRVQKYSNVIPISPSQGLLACDRLGEGRMASLEVIQLAIESAFLQSNNNDSPIKDWEGYKLLITTGATIEDLDAARYITNRSSGKMGILLGQAARFRGAIVDLVHGPIGISHAFLEGLNTFPIRNANEMQAMIKNLQPDKDVIAMTAAISDIRKKGALTEQKIQKKDLIELINENLELVPDLLTEIVSQRKNKQLVIGFTALSGSDKEIKKLAILKKQNKGCDFLFANPIDRANQGFESDHNGGWLLGPQDSITSIPVNSKMAIAHQLLDELLQDLKKSSKKN